MRIVALLLSTILPVVISMAQTGPGGIGNSTNNILWLDASYGITTAGSGISGWADRSGNNNHASQANALLQPNVFNASMNGYRTVEFDNDQTNYDYMVIPDNATLEGMSGLTGFVVYRLNSGTSSGAPRCFFSKRDGVDTQEAYDWFIWNNGADITQHLDIDNTSHRASSTNPVSTGVNYINGFTYHGAAPSDANDQVLYNGNTAVGNRSEGSTSIPNYSSHVYVGTLRGHTGSGSGSSRFNGSMAEIILYNQTLNDAQRIIVNNYLSARYDIALASSDVYLQDNGVNGNFDHDVAGIGRVNGTNQHTDSRGTGLVRINGATGLGDNEFLMWGHNNGVVGTFGSTDLPSGVQGRWGRVWRVSEVSTSGTPVDVGAVDLTFDLTGLGSVDPGHLRLLVDTDNDGLFADETPISGATSVGNGQYRFAGVSAITDGLRFTLGTTNNGQTPLPIELLDFSVTAEGDQVRCTWSTASERDNASFVVHRSPDLSSWSTVGELPGAGNSSSILHYAFIDVRVPSGTHYYRLQQIDHDGTSTFSSVEVVQLLGQRFLSVFPNPAHDHLTITNAQGELSVSDVMGRRIPVPSERREGSVVLDLSRLTPGVYVVQSDGPGQPACRIVVE
ncbi:MAG TPA: T9SS type A sorting domain-containing protein [Flavobacteriales bacterium]